MFLFQYFIEAGIFFTIPLFLSFVLELSAIETGTSAIVADDQETPEPT